MFAILVCLVFGTFQHYGITWDEPTQNHYGGLVDQYYRDLLHGHYNLKLILDDYNFRYYGGLFDAAAIVLEHFLPLDVFDTRHLLNAFVGLLGIAGCWKLARALGGYPAAFWAALLLALTPRYWGPMFNNPKDIPFAAGYVWAAYYLVLAIPLLPRIPWKLCLKLSITIGLTLGVRVGAILLLAYFTAMQFGFIIFRIVREQSIRKAGRQLAAALPRLLATAGCSWILMLLCWPWAQAHPLTAPFEAFAYFNSFPWKGTVLFHGRYFAAGALPRTYTLEWLGITLPESILVLLSVALILVLRTIWMYRQTLTQEVFAQYAFTAFMIAFPLAYILITRPVLYDAERHSLYLVPVIASVCGSVWAWLLRRMYSSNRAAALLLLAVFGVYLTWHTSVILHLHPHEYVYFNRIVGGLHGAAGHYETDYWGNSYREGVKLLIDYIQRERVVDSRKQYRIYMTSTQRVSAAHYFPSYFKITYDPQTADFSLAITRYGISDQLGGCKIGQVERFGVPLAVIKNLRCSATSIRAASRKPAREHL